MALSSDIADAAGLVRLADVSSEVAHQSVHESALPRWVADATAPKSRVVFVNRYFFPDVSATSQILFDLAKRLVEHGVEVHVVCSRQLYDEPAADLPRTEIVHGVQVHRAWTSRYGRGRLMGRALDYASFYFTAASKLLGLLGNKDVLIAKTDPPLISIVAAIIAWVRGAHLVNWLQDVFPEVASKLDANPLPPWLNRALQWARDRSLKGAEANVVLGNRMRAHLQTRNVPGSRIRIIENWADGNTVAPIEACSSRLRRALGLQDKFVVGYSGNLGRAHEFETLLAAAQHMRDRKDVAFLMIGGGHKMQKLQAAVDARGLTNFIFQPYQPRQHLADSLGAADVHLASLLPELEGLIVPSKCYGVLSAGRPLVFIGDVDGEISRMVVTGGCGFAVSRGDAAALVSTLDRLSQDAALRVQMGSRAREVFLEMYTVERAVGQWRQLLDELPPRAQGMGRA